VVSGVTVASGASEVIQPGGTAIGNRDGGTVTVGSSGVDSGGTILSGGAEKVSAGGTASGTVIDSGATATVSSGGTAENPTVSSGGVLNVLPGGVEFGGTVLSGTTFYVSSGITVNSMTVAAGGSILVLFGGVASGIDDFGNVTVSSGGKLFDPIESGGLVSVTAGASTVDTVISSGGTEIVFSGGTVVAPVVASGGSLIMSSGATDLGAVILSGQTQTIGNGVVFAGGTTLAGGSLVIQSGGIDSGLFDQGTVIISGTNTSDGIAAGGIEEVASGGALVEAALQGGTLVILSGGSADLTSSVNNGAIVFSGSGPEQLTIDGNLAPAAAISGFTDPAVGGKTIDITGIGSAVTSSSITFSSGAETLTVSGTLGTVTVKLAAGSTPGQLALTTDGRGGILVICFAEGTRIATTNGDVAVEALREGDWVLTALGDVARVRWIGHRRFSLASRPDVAPIRLSEGSLGEGVPSRDLLVSPEHAMGLGGKLVPARLLVNGTSITRDTSMAGITYYHVELPRHDLLLAEGAAAESWLDTGNRGMFANAPGSVDLYADLEPDLTSEAWQTQACAPLVEGGLDLAVIRARLEGRAIILGYGGGAAQTLWLETQGKHSIALPAGGGLLRLASVAARAPGDERRLGRRSPR
jgi:autotransporter passenger strand-loop-strand repeat protein